MLVPADFGNVECPTKREFPGKISGHSLDFLTQLEIEKLQRVQGTYFLYETLTASNPGKMWGKYHLLITLLLLYKLGVEILTKLF